MALLRRFVPIIRSNLIPYVQCKNISRWRAPTLIELKKREKKNGGKKNNPRNTFLEWNLESELYAFRKRLNEDFDSDLLLQAFTDRSYVIQEEMKQKEVDFDFKMKDSRELSKEGEAFMKEYIQLYLEHVLPKFPSEGIISVRDYLLSEQVLSDISLHIGTKDIILASKYPVKKTILANTFTAVVGALIQSSGNERAAHFVRDFVITYLQGKDINDYWQIEDPWSMLLNVLGEDSSKLEPRLIGDVGKNTLLACYRVGLYLDKKMISAGFGESVATAKEMAAREALKKVFGTEDHMAPINFLVEGIPKPQTQRQQISEN